MFSDGGAAERNGCSTASHVPLSSGSVSFTLDCLWPRGVFRGGAGHGRTAHYVRILVLITDKRRRLVSFELEKLWFSLCDSGKRLACDPWCVQGAQCHCAQYREQSSILLQYLLAGRQAGARRTHTHERRRRCSPSVRENTHMPPVSLGDVAGAILDANLPIGGGGAPILARRKGPERKIAEAKAEEKAQLQLARAKRSLSEQPHKALKGAQQVTTTDLVLETSLRKIATKGVVALFNAVRSAQKDKDEDSGRKVCTLPHDFAACMNVFANPRWRVYESLYACV